VPDGEGAENDEEGNGEDETDRPNLSSWRKGFMRKWKVELVKSAKGIISYRCQKPGCPYVMRHKQDKVVGTWELQVKH
jgi:hypothetical protein